MTVYTDSRNAFAQAVNGGVLASWPPIKETAWSDGGYPRTTRIEPDRTARQLAALLAACAIGLAVVAAWKAVRR